MTFRRPQVRRTTRHLIRLTVVALLTAIAAIGPAVPASAHNVLLSSNPADGAVLQAGPTTVRLTFDQPVENFQPVVTVLGPDGQRYESGAPQVDSTEVTASVGALPGAGDYVIAYRVVSADGHPVAGEIRFRLDAPTSSGAPVSGPVSSTPGSAPSSPAPSSPAPFSSAPSSSAPSSSAPAVPTTAAVAPASSSSGLSGWVWAAIALAAFLVAAAGVVIARRPRSDQL